MTTSERLTKWADCVKLENFTGTHGVKWRCIIGGIEMEDYSIEIAVRKADEAVSESRRLAAEQGQQAGKE